MTFAARITSSLASFSFCTPMRVMMVALGYYPVCSTPVFFFFNQVFNFSIVFRNGLLFPHVQ